MMAFFPVPYEDELLYSILARYHIRSGNLSYKATIQDAFSSKTATAIVDLPCNIQSLIKNMPPTSSFTPDEIIERHAMFPFYTAFMPPERVKEIKSSMLGNRGGDIYCRAGIMAGSITPNRFLRFCPRCADEDLFKYGEMYWHRSHQIPCVICPEHGILLEDSCVLVSGFNKHQFIAANKTNYKKEKKQEELSAEMMQHLSELTLDTKYLMDNSLTNRETEWFRSQYIELLKEKGYATINGSIHRKKLLKDFIEFYGNEFLAYVQSEVSLYKEANWLTDMLYNKERTAHPIRHLLLIRFLGVSVLDIFYRKFEYCPFGTGPWLCLNSVAEHYLQPVVQEVKITYGCDNKKPIGTFYCQCGFIYTRSECDVNDTAQYTYSKIKEFGHVWEKRLEEVVSMRFSLRETARAMGVDPATVKKYARKFGLQTFWQERQDGNKKNAEVDNADNVTKAHTIEHYRNDWLILQIQYPEKGVKELRFIGGKVYTWLYRFDKEWLSQNSPEKKCVYVNKRVDWHHRDKELLQIVKKVVQEMVSSNERPRQINISIIGVTLGVRALLQKHLDKLPATKAYIESVAESDRDFRLRRVCWAIKAMEEEGQEVKAWKIMKKAGIRKEFEEEVREIIDEFLTH